MLIYIKDKLCLSFIEIIRDYLFYTDNIFNVILYFFQRKKYIKKESFPFFLTVKMRELAQFSKYLSILLKFRRNLEKSSISSDKRIENREIAPISSQFEENVSFSKAFNKMLGHFVEKSLISIRFRRNREIKAPK